MKLALDRIYEALSAVPRVDTDRPVYSVGPVPDFPGYFVGKDSDERACLLQSLIGIPGIMRRSGLRA